MSSRMDAVQSPIIPIIGEWIRRHPARSRWGRAWSPMARRREAIEAIAPFLADPGATAMGRSRDARTGRDAAPAKLTTRKSPRSRSKSRDLRDCRAAISAFMNAVLAVADPGDEIILQTPFYFNHEMADGDGQLPAGGGAQPTSVISSASTRSAPPSRRGRAPSSRSRRTTRAARCTRRAICAPSTRCARSAACGTSRRGLRVLHLRSGDARVAGRGSRRRGAHDLALLAVEGVRVRELAHRLHGGPGDAVAAVNKIQDTLLICAPHVSQAAAIGALRGGARLLRSSRRHAGRRARVACSSAVGESAISARSPIGGWRLLLPAAHAHGHGRDDARRTSDPRASRRDGARHDLRADEGCYLRVSYGALAPETVDEGVGQTRWTGLKVRVG